MPTTPYTEESAGSASWTEESAVTTTQTEESAITVDWDKDLLHRQTYSELNEFQYDDLQRYTYTQLERETTWTEESATSTGHAEEATSYPIGLLLILLYPTKSS